MANMKNVLKNGDRFETKHNGWLTVVDYINSTTVVCQFDVTGTKTTVQAVQVRKGLVKDDLRPNVIGAYFGLGKYNSTHIAYEVWTGIIDRIIKQPSGYEGSSLSVEWLNYQCFAQWYEANVIGVPNPHIDKDIIDMGNKVYSSSTCCIVPCEINKAFVGTMRNGQPAKGAYKVKNSRWQAAVNEGGTQRCLGTFDTYTEAYATYKVHKEQYVRGLALKYKDVLNPHIFELISNYSIGCSV